MPLHKVDILAGYGTAFGLLAVLQATLVSALAFGLLGLDVAGPKWVVVLLAIANAVPGSTLGLFVSAFAETEFRARTAADNFDARFALNVAVVCGCVVLAIALGGATLRRRTE